MKSLNKKISSILLAGMVVMGGVISSGVSSFAASANKVSVKNSQQDLQRVKFFSQDYGKIIGFNKDKNNLRKIYKEILGDSYVLNVRIKKPAEIAKRLFDAKCRKQKFVILQFKGLYYLIQIQ